MTGQLFHVILDFLNGTWSFKKAVRATPAFQLVISRRIYYSFLLGWCGLNFFSVKN